MGSLRLFIALDTPTDVKSALMELIRQLQTPNADVRWESPEKLHLTLKFLGDIASDHVPAIMEALGNARQTIPPLAVSYEGVGCFPHRRNPRVLWVGVNETTGNLATLAAAVERAMREFGVDPEDRAFHPHVTLGRVKGTRNLPRLIATLDSVTFGRHEALLGEIRLVKSDLRPTGSVYTVLKSIPLTGNSPRSA